MPSSHEPDRGEQSQLLASLVAFLDEHRYCGELDGGADEEWVWMTCTCGAVISRALDSEDRRLRG
jgi:hypothetical protein